MRRFEQRIIDDDTGEIVYKRSSVLKALVKDDKGYLYLNNTFDLVRFSPKMIWPEISRMDKGYWLDLLAASKGNEIPTPLRELADCLDLSTRRTYSLLTRLRSLGMVKRSGKRWYANPIYGFHGKWLSPDLYRLFQTDLDGHLPKWVISQLKNMT